MSIEEDEKLIDIEGEFIFRGPHLFSETNKVKLGDEIPKTPENTIAINVKQVENKNEFYFNIKGSDELFCSHYAWAFVKINDENLVNYRRYLQIECQLNIVKNCARHALNIVETLEKKKVSSSQSETFNLNTDIKNIHTGVEVNG